MRLLALLTVIACGVGCQTTDRRPLTRTGDALDRLAAQLAEADAAQRRAAGRPLHAEPAEADLETLVGRTREEVTAALGEGNCALRFGDVCAEQQGQVTYYFYSLPPSWTGGGDEVTLYFDEEGRCVRYDHVRTQ